MANPDHVEILQKGIQAWNQWRIDFRNVKPDLSHAQLKSKDLLGFDLRESNLQGVNFEDCMLNGAVLNQSICSEANLSGASLRHVVAMQADFTSANLSTARTDGANFRASNFHMANLQKAALTNSDLVRTDFSDACLTNANLYFSNLTKANLSRAVVRGADLRSTVMVEAILKSADLSGCLVHGISVWDIKSEGAIQSNLIITPPEELVISVDNLEIAQFIYLILNNDNIRNVIDTITSKVVLILGRFTPDRKPVLDALREELRSRNYLPILFDFDKPASRDLTETISTLAHMARFVIADITDARSIAQELERFVEGLPSVPVQPLLLASQHEYGMFEHFRRYHWVLEPVLYADQKTLLADLKASVIAPAEAKVKEQTGR